MNDNPKWQNPKATIFFFSTSKVFSKKKLNNPTTLFFFQTFYFPLTKNDQSAKKCKKFQKNPYEWKSFSPFLHNFWKKKVYFPFFFYFVNVFTQKRTRVIAHLRFANARSWLVVLVIGKIATGTKMNQLIKKNQLKNLK